MAEKKDEKKDERTLEMRIAELENRLGLGAQQMEFTEQEVASYNKIADALGVGAGAESPALLSCGGCICAPGSYRVQVCRIQTCRVQPCRIQPCRIQTCRIQSCRVQQCISQCISQCINECVACYASDYAADLSGGFGTLGY